MKAIFVGLIVVAVVFAIVSPAAAVSFTLTFTGATDPTFMGLPTGDAYTAVYNFDTAETTNDSANHLPPTPNYFDIFVPTSATMTINDTTFSIGPTSGEIIICSVCAGANFGLLEVAGVAGGLTNILYAHLTPNQFPPTLDAPLNFTVVSNTTDGQGSRGQFGGLSLVPLTVSVSTSETPLPATLPLFATGLGALGLLGWRRKRKTISAR